MDLVCCPECGDPISERLGGEGYHRGCCPHDPTDVEELDDRDGAGGRRWAYCSGCGAEVTPVQDEDGIHYEEAI